MQMKSSIAIALTSLGSFLVEGQSQSSQADLYLPTYTDCPNGLSVRNASEGLSDKERAWRRERARDVKASLGTYLKTANVSGLDVSSYIDKLDSDNVPVVGLTISGGGTQSGIGGLGVWQAFDARYARAVSAGTGGLTQVLSYMTGLSGGGAATVAILATNDFSSVADIKKSTNFSNPWDEPTDKEAEILFENVGAKAEAGFPVSVTDVFGQFWATWVPEDWTFASYSAIATNDTKFKSGQAPMPIITLSEVIPGVSPEIGKIMYPGRNDTNGFNLTSYEVTPYEFGSWAGGRIQAFMPTEYLGTAMSEGKVQNKSECVVGFDKMSFIQGSTADAFCAWFIDDFYSIPVFAKRDSSQSSSGTGDIPIPEDQYENPLVQLVNETASNFEQTFNASLWSTYPNPFESYNAPMKDVSELLLVDGSLGGENNPIRPLIVPERGVEFIIVYEASSEGTYAWVNGTSLQNTAKSASEGGIPFPMIPSVDTMITQNFSSQPTFYGCDATDETPLVLYLPNSPWTGYSNFSYTKGAFTNEQLNDTLENAFQLTTYGNGTIDSEWPSCLACATIKRSLARMDMNLPDQCKKCFERHCWHGKESNARVTEADLDLRPRLNPDLTFAEWNRTVWEPDQSNFNVTEEDGKTGGASIFRGGSAVVLAGAAAAVLLVT